MQVQIKKLHPDFVLPEYKHPGDAGMDVRALEIGTYMMFSNEHVDEDSQGFEFKVERDWEIGASDQKFITLESGDRCSFRLGFATAIPPGYEVQLRTRSGLALKQGLIVANSPATIDEGYRGEYAVIILNASKIPQVVEREERIAQLVLKRVEAVEWAQTDDLGDTSRGEGGFGSTGIT